MIGYVERYWEDYKKFLTFLGRAIPQPRSEVRYRVNANGDMTRAMLFLFLAVLTSCLFSALSFGRSINDITYFVVAVIQNAAFLFVSYFAVSCVWKLFGYKGDFGKLIRAGLYFSALLTVLLSIYITIYIGAMKLIDETTHAAYLELVRMGTGCPMDIDRMREIADIFLRGERFPYLAHLGFALVFFIGAIVYGIASLRLYYELHPIGFWTRIGMFICAGLLALAFYVPTLMFSYAIGNGVGCPI